MCGGTVVTDTGLFAFVSFPCVSPKVEPGRGVHSLCRGKGRGEIQEKEEGRLLKIAAWH